MSLYECASCGALYKSNGKPDECASCSDTRSGRLLFRRIDDVDELLS